MGDLEKWGFIGDTGQFAYSIIYPITAAIIIFAIFLKQSPTAIPNGLAKFLNL